MRRRCVAIPLSAETCKVKQSVYTFCVLAKSVRSIDIMSYEIGVCTLLSARGVSVASVPTRTKVHRDTIEILFG
jgi:hypothetical protein